VKEAAAEQLVPTTLNRKGENAPLGAKRSFLLNMYRGLLFDSRLLDPE